MKKFFFVSFLVIVGFFILNKLSVPSFDSYREKANKNEVKTESQDDNHQIFTDKNGNKRQIYIGTPADTLLEIRGKGLYSNKIGNDDNGLLVEWIYQDYIYLLGLRTVDGIKCYRVIKIASASEKK